METPPAPARPRRRLRWWQIVLFALLLLGVAFRVTLPFAARRLIESKGSEVLGAPISVANVDFGLLSARAAVDGLVIGAPGSAPAPAAAPVPPTAPGPEPAPALLRCNRIAVQLGPQALLRRELHVRSLEVDAPDVRLERAADGRLVLPAPPPKTEPTEPEPKSDSKPFAVVLDALALRALHSELLEAHGTETHSVQLDLEEFTLADVALREGALSLGGVGIRGPKLHVRYDLLLAPREAPPPAPKPEPEPAPAAPAAASEPGSRLRLADLQIERAELVLASDQTTLPLVLTLSLRERAGAPDEHDIALHTEMADGSLDVEGRVSQRDLGFDGKVRWSDVALTKVLAAAGVLPVRVDAGQGTGELSVRAALAPKQGSAAVQVSGSASVRGLQLEDTQGDFGLAFSALELAVDEVRVPIPREGADPEPLRVSLSSVALREPAVRVRRPEPALGAPPPEPEAAQPAAKAAAPPEIRARDVSISGGRVAFSDATVRPTFSAELRDVALSADELAWPERSARGLVFSARGPGAAAYKVTGTLAPSGGAVKLALGAVPLPVANPYLAGAGLRIERGTLNLDGGLRAKGERTDFNSRLRVAALNVSGSGNEGLVSQIGVPVDVAVALLKDRRGVINLPLAFRVERGEVRTGLTRTLVAAMRRAVTGALVLPLRGLGGALGMLGGAVGGALGVGIDPLPAPAGVAELDPAAAPRLEELRATLAERPALRLVLRGRAGSEDDPALAERMLAERALAGGDLPELSPAGFLQKRRIRGALADRARGRAGELEPADAELLRRAAEKVSVPRERRDALAAQRAEAARAALLSDGGIEAERIELGESESGSPGVVFALAAAQS